MHKAPRVLVGRTWDRVSLSGAREADLTSRRQPESRDPRVGEEPSLDGAREGVLSRNSSARQSPLTAPRILVTLDGSKGPRTPGLVFFGGTAVLTGHVRSRALRFKEKRS